MSCILRKFLVILSIPVFSGCAAGCTPFFQRPESLVIMTYNLHNLFDAVCDGSEYPEFCPESGNWDETAYHARLDDFGRVIRGIKGTAGQGPDILVLTEIENQRVVEDLRRRALGERRYPYYAVTDVAENAIEIAVLSRIPFDSPRIHAVSPLDGRRIRPILELRMLPGNRSNPDHLYLFACHWPSKIGGELETSVHRRQAAAVVARRIHEISQTEPHALVMVAGDLNQTLPDDSDEFRMRSLMSAVYLESGVYDAESELAPLFVSGEIADARTSDMILYSPWFMTDFPGSFVFREEWEAIDHFLLGQGLTGEVWRPVDFLVEAREWMLTPRGYPRGYRSSQRTGLSDHLPIVLFLERL
ncbi:endonuclease/exonuclease/phosphatase family protein [Spirochaeta dissipatitropha]